MLASNDQIRRVVEEISRGAPGAGELAKLLELSPSRIENPVANAVADAVVRRVKTSLPGGISQGMRIYYGFSVYMETGTYAALFYPSATRHPHDDVLVSPVDWSAFSTAVLCQTIYHVTSSTRGVMRKDDIDRAVDAANLVLHEGLFRWYAGMLERVMPAFGAAAAALGGPAEAGRRYAEVLRSSHWIAMTNELIRGGHAGDLEWSLYHHFIKLWALSRDEGLVESVAGALAEKLISCPVTVGPARWRGYRAWLAPDKIDQSRFREAEARILRPITYFSHEGFPTEFAEGYSREFLDEGPGKPYRNGSGCFARGAMVRMAGGALRAIEAIQRGDAVETPSGARRVATVVAVPRGRAPLFSIAGCAAGFTAMHPIRGAGEPGAPRHLSIDARSSSPTLQRLGVGRLAHGARVLAHAEGGPRPWIVERITRRDAGDPGEELYDVLLEPDETGTSEYFVGDAERQILVSSDLPIFADAAPATRAVVTVLAALRPALSHVALEAAPESDLAWSLLAHAISDGVLPRAARRALSDAAPPAEAEDARPPEALVAAQMDAFDLPGDVPRYDWSAGRLGSMLLAAHGEELEGAIEMGWRRFPEGAPPEEAVLAVSIVSVRLDAGHPSLAEGPLEISVAPGGSPGDAVSLRHDGAAGDTRFARRVHEALYLDRWTASGEALGLVFRIDLPRRERAIGWTADARIPWPLRGGYRAGEAVVRSAGDVELGVLRFDVRLLSRSDAALERAARAGWDAGERDRFARALGHACADELARRIERIGAAAVTRLGPDRAP